MTRVSTRTRQDAARLALGAMLVLAGASHLTVARREFRAQVPPWIPMDTDDVVLLSGAAEIALGAALAGLPKERRRVGGLAAAFFTAIFPGTSRSTATGSTVSGSTPTRSARRGWPDSRCWSRGRSTRAGWSRAGEPVPGGDRASAMITRWTRWCGSGSSSSRSVRCWAGRSWCR
ncbi:hypothetical protein [Pseudonocardia sp. ICBG1293]|uniref:DoxX family protein n=1 Tax=Pseudonocardia sp. ICBG1293 TaxID=2844382 RepID=UPI001CCA75E5|nr:hypothetical protein [Pseudonocardia sp. ICBG1293]